MQPRRWLQYGCELDGGSNTGARGSCDWRQRLQMRRRGDEVRNPGGKPHGFIGATDARRETVRLNLQACHDTPPHHVAGYAPAIPILSHQNHAGRFAFPKQTRTLFPQREYGSKDLFSSPHGPRSSRASPTVSTVVPMRDGPTSGQNSGTQGSREPRSANQVQIGLTLDKSP